jgi:hypothetical protein
VRHDVDPFAVQMIRNHLNPSRINVVHFLKQKSCRTPVDLFRPSTSLMLFGFQDVDARDKRGHDESITQAVGITDRI